MPPSPTSRRPTARRRILRHVAVGVLGAVLLGAGASVAALRMSLPKVDGLVDLPGLDRPEATIDRDREGHVTVRAGSRSDAAQALGFAHAQDRFFQMDLLRRAGSGRLAGLLGPALIDHDQRVRRFQGAALAREALQLLPPAERDILVAYARGVNAALEHAIVPPPEYLLLRATPEAWRPEDSLVLNLTFAFMLQDPEAHGDLERTLLRDAVGPVAYAFFHPRGSHLDAPLDRVPLPEAPVPSPAAFSVPPPPATASHEAGNEAGDEDPGNPVPGSNAWAVAGRLTRSGAALVADDMHLGISAPGIWYRAVLHWTDPDGRERMLAGVTVPGAPTVITGSNGRVAWGFTNAMLDTADLVALRLDPARPGQYLTPEGWRPFAVHEESIEVAHGASRALRVTNTVWGPVLGPGPSGVTHAVAWAMAQPAALAATSRALEDATNVTQAIEAAQAAPRPVQNFVVGDRSGAIGWTLIGVLPKRGSGSGEFAEDWSQPGAPWRGLLAAHERPLVLNPPGGRIWTANQRIVGSPEYLALGDGGWDLGARAARIRDDLMALPQATPADMLAIQLDDTIPMLLPWHQRLLDAMASLAASAPAASAQAWSGARQRLRDWDGRASADSVVLPVVARFRRHAIALLHEPVGWAIDRSLGAPGEDRALAGARHGYRPGPQAEGVAERLLRERPPHLLHPRHASYEDLLAEAARRALVTGPGPDPGPLPTWGHVNRTQIRHRLSPALPRWIARWLDMEREPQPGFHYGLPRIAGPDFGASQRFGIEPGHETGSYLHTPAGQSGHFLSPCYRNSHPDWLHGRPTPLLGHPAVHRLTLTRRKG